MKNVLITGGSRGIGKATVDYFLSKGWYVYTTSTSGKIDYNAENLSVHMLNLGKPESINLLVETLQKSGITFDTLINNAWEETRKEHENKDMKIEQLTRTLNTNLVGTVNLTQKMLPLMNKESVIVNISSEYGSLTEDWGYVAMPYRIAKAGLNMFTRNFYKHPKVLAQNIKVYSFDPGWVKTDMGGPNAPGDPKEPAKELFDLINSGLPSGEFYRGLEKRDW